jgi:hypothetical protein
MISFLPSPSFFYHFWSGGSVLKIAKGDINLNIRHLSLLAYVGNKFVVLSTVTVRRRKYANSNKDEAVGEVINVTEVKKVLLRLNMILITLRASVGLHSLPEADISENITVYEPRTTRSSAHHGPFIFYGRYILVSHVVSSSSHFHIKCNHTSSSLFCFWSFCDSEVLFLGHNLPFHALNMIVSATCRWVYEVEEHEGWSIIP